MDVVIAGGGDDLLRNEGDTCIPDAAIQNGGGIRNDAVIPAGEITTGDTWDIAPFGNFAVVGKVPRDTFHVLLERAVDRIPGAGGQFPQVSGFTFTYDPAAPARETDRAGDCSLAGDPGSRIREVTLDDGTAIVRDGAVVPGDPVVLATIDLLANGGDCYPLAGIEFTKLGVSYQQALADYISEDQGATITAADYPAGGDNRIVALAAEPEPEPTPTPEPEPTPEPHPETMFEGGQALPARGRLLRLVSLGWGRWWNIDHGVPGESSSLSVRLLRALSDED